MSFYQRGEVIWAKVIGFPWWPAVIISYIPKKDENDKSENVTVNFIGENTHAYLNEEKIKKYLENFEKFGGNTKAKKLKDSIDRAHKIMNGETNKFPTIPEKNEVSKNEIIERNLDLKSSKSKLLIKVKNKKLKNFRYKKEILTKERNLQEVFNKGKILPEPSKKLKIKENPHPQRKKIKKKLRNIKINTSSSFRFPITKPPTKIENLETAFNFFQNEIELKQILSDLMKLFEDKDKCMIESDIKNISTKLLETLQLIDKTLKQEYETFNRNSLLILLKEGYGKYIASITKIFETYKPELNEIFINFKQKFTEIFDKIKEFFFNRYLCVDEELLEKYKVDLNLKEEKKSRKNSGFSKIKSLSISSESENLKDISLEQEPNENQHKNVVFNDPNLEFNHFRKKLCVKIAKTLQMQYNYEKQKSHEITMKIERKLRKEFPLLNSDYKSNGIMLLNLLKNNSMDILKLIDNIEEIAAKNSFNNNQEDIDESLRDKRSNSL